MQKMIILLFLEVGDKPNSKSDSHILQLPNRTKKAPILGLSILIESLLFVVIYFFHQSQGNKFLLVDFLS
jgi:hypothetical protein